MKRGRAVVLLFFSELMRKAEALHKHAPFAQLFSAIGVKLKVRGEGIKSVIFSRDEKSALC